MQVVGIQGYGLEGGSVDNGHKMEKLSIIIPAYNEGLWISQTLNSYVDYFSRVNTEGLQLIVVCNGCTDDTPRIAREYCQRCPQIKAIDIPERVGKGRAIREGFRMADGDIIAFVDADGAITPVRCTVWSR